MKIRRFLGFSVPLLLILLHFIFPAPCAAQIADTTVYEFADEAPFPLFPACAQDRHTGWTKDSTRRCAETLLLGLLSQNVRYPEEARQINLEGTVVVNFVVEPSGRISNTTILRDIGGGCGPEALRVLKALDTLGMRWQPALRNGKPVRVRHTVPLRFKLQTPLPYYLTETGDTVYTDVERPAEFEGGIEAINRFILNRLEYPANERDSCKTGILEMAVLIRPDGRPEVQNQLDFSNLGLDFQFNALQLVNRMQGLWTPAVYNGRPVSTAFPLRVVFKSPAPGCAAANANFDNAILLADEAVKLLDNKQTEASLEKLNAALRLQPRSTELLYYRATAYLNLKQNDKACADFAKIKATLGHTWFEDLQRLVCKNP